MDPFTIARRRARAALEDAVQRVGIPMDYIVFPHQDDHEQLRVEWPHLVRWLEDDNSIALIYFDTELTGMVSGDDLHRISLSADFYADDFGFEHPYRFELPFDITDIEPMHRQSWETLPKAKLPRRKRFLQPKVNL